MSVMPTNLWRERFGSFYDAGKIYLDYDEMLSDDAVDAVIKARYYMLAHGCHQVDLARSFAGPIKAVHARSLNRFGAYCWFVETEFENGALGHLDLTVAVRMDWHEGFQIYGEHGSAMGKIFNPWYYKSSEVDLFREKDATTSRMLGADGHFYRRQLEGFAAGAKQAAEK
jgi:predicted dehydrogenase